MVCDGLCKSVVIGRQSGKEVKLVMQREPSTGTIWFSSGTLRPNDALIDADIRGLAEQMSITVHSDYR
jgi:hypothetical protein